MDTITVVQKGAKRFSITLENGNKVSVAQAKDGLGIFFYHSGSDKKLEFGLSQDAVSALVLLINKIQPITTRELLFNIMIEAAEQASNEKEAEFVENLEEGVIFKDGEI